MPRKPVNSFDELDEDFVASEGTKFVDLDAGIYTAHVEDMVQVYDDKKGPSVQIKLKVTSQAHGEQFIGKKVTLFFNFKRLDKDSNSLVKNHVAIDQFKTLTDRLGIFASGLSEAAERVREELNDNEVSLKARHSIGKDGKNYVNYDILSVTPF